MQYFLIAPTQGQRAVQAMENAQDRFYCNQPTAQQPAYTASYAGERLCICTDSAELARLFTAELQRSGVVHQVPDQQPGKLMPC